ncbi:MAG: hypothetical protein K6E59_01790 [Bacilli bacterium]|nr:hypothetical protein [Bacilli bacterium]
MKKATLLLFPMLLASCASGGGSGSSEYSYERQTTFDYDVDTSVTGDSRTGYEIFVGSFADSNGDGYGDLKGIEDKLDYLKAIGASILWLTPIHPSATYHHYDVEDYYAVASQFGDLDAFSSLCQKASQKGMTVIMDMVFNHASTRSTLFKTALEDYVSGNTSSTSKKDYFRFSDAAPSQTKEGQVFRSIQYGGKTVWYECDFDSTMADFNLDAQVVRDFHEEVMRFWIGKGAGGFRYDGVAYYYAGEQAKNTEYAGYLATKAKAIKEDVYLIVENWESSSSYARIGAFAGVGQHAFNFRNSVDGTNYSFVTYVNQKKGSSVSANTVSLQKEIAKKSPDGDPVFFLSNHDQDRVYNYTSLYSSDRVEKMKCIASLYLLTPGTPFMYYGEEIGLQGSRGSANTDANRRLPMIWQPTNDFARCSDPVGTTYKADDRALEAALKSVASGNGLARHYVKLNQIRAKFPAISKGTYAQLEGADTTLAAYTISYQGKDYVLATNLDSKCGYFNLPEGTYSIVDEVTTVGVPAQLSGSKVALPEYSSVLLAKTA